LRHKNFSQNHAPFNGGLSHFFGAGYKVSCIFPKKEKEKDDGYALYSLMLQAW
jgi:hypothetical protein